MTVKHFPRLYGEGSKGGTKEWEISVAESPSGAWGIIVTEFGGTGAKMQHSEKIIKEGKNVGKSNETTPFQQACADAESDYQKKIKKGYRHSIAELQGLMDTNTMLDGGASSAKSTHILQGVSDGTINPDDVNYKMEAMVGGKPILPMLAHTYEKRKKDIKWPCYAQAKIDGHRAYGMGGKLLSRGGDPVPGLVNMPEVQKELEKLAELLGDGVWYDGELYTEAMPFEKVSGCIRRARLVDEAIPLLPHVKFYLFDVFKPGDPEWPNSARADAADKAFFATHFDRIRIVPCALVRNEAELMTFHDQCIQEGFEGAIVRNAAGQYKIGHRSKDLQKFKMFKDEEFEVVGFTEGTGSDAGSVIWICTKTPGLHTNVGNEPTFNVRPIGDLAYRRDLFNHGKDFIGKQLTVRYQNLTEYGLPRFPVGRGIREEGE